MKNLLFLTLIFAFVGCGKDYNRSQTVHQQQTNNDTLYFKEDMKPINGNLYDDFNSKRLLIGEYKNGLKEGMHREHQGIQLTFEGEFLKGKPTGLHKKWDYGQLTFAGEYINGIPVGTHKYWYVNGQLIRQEKYLNGKIIGGTKYWKRDGKLDYVSFVKKDGLEIRYFYDDSNNLKVMKFFKGNEITKKVTFGQDGLISRKIYRYKENGWRISKTENFREGIIVYRSTWESDIPYYYESD